MEKKTDDKIIIAMLDEGKAQKDIAEHFGVSPAAICKRVKLLRPTSKSFNRLTEKQKQFVIAKSNGKSATQAVMESYDVAERKTAKVMAHELMQKPDINIAFAELMPTEGLTRRYRTKKLKEHVDSLNPDISLRALDQTHKLDGAYAPQEINVHFDYDANNRSIAELDAEVKRLQQEGEIIDITPAPREVDLTE